MNKVTSFRRSNAALHVEHLIISMLAQANANAPRQPNKSRYSVPRPPMAELAKLQTERPPLMPLPP